MAGFGAKVRDWFNGGDPQGHIKIRHWLRGYDDRSEGYTYGMMGPAMVLSVVAAILYPLTRGYGSIVALTLAIFLLLGRHMIERQVAGVASYWRRASWRSEATPATCRSIMWRPSSRKIARVRATMLP